MKRDAIEELFEYTGWAWERLVRVIEGPAAKLYATPAPGSGWPTLAACLSHVLATYDGWLNGPWGRLQLGAMSYPAEWPKPIDDWHVLLAYRERVRDAFRQALDVPDDLLYDRRFQDEGGGEALSRADILTNLVLHERGHHGDLNTLFSQHGITGFFVDYTFFRTHPTEFVPDDGEH